MEMWSDKKNTSLTLTGQSFTKDDTRKRSAAFQSPARTPRVDGKLRRPGRLQPISAHPPKSRVFSFLLTSSGGFLGKYFQNIKVTKFVGVVSGDCRS